MEFHTHDDFVRHVKANGIPVAELPLAVRQAYQEAGMAIPAVRQQIGVITPPTADTGKCCHCGRDVPAGQHERAHAVAMFEHATHPETGALLRLRVLHCDDCLDSDACSPDVPTPGSGHTDQPAGFCHAIEGG